MIEIKNDVSSITWIILGCILIIGMIYTYIKRPRCEKCNAPLKLVRAEDNYSINITNNIRIGPLIDGIPIEEKNFYKCPKCGNKSLLKTRIWH